MDVVAGGRRRSADDLAQALVRPHHRHPPVAFNLLSRLRVRRANGDLRMTLFDVPIFIMG
jgi:hypothetical protein